MGQTEAKPYSKYDLNDLNLDIAERKVLNQSNYRWIECNDKNDPNFGKKLFSYYNGYNWDDIENLPKKMLKHRIKNVVVGHEADGTPNTIRTIITGSWKKNRKTLVHYHGFGGSAALNFKVFQDLSSDFNQISFDIIGMGGSSRATDFSIDFTPAQCLEYFIEYFEKWRVAMSDSFKYFQGKELTDFYIIGHSFGGYLSTHYALRYPQHIKKLFLLSPVGLTDINSLTKERPKRKAGSIEGFLCWNFRTCPQQLSQILGPRKMYETFKGWFDTYQKQEHPALMQENIIDYVYQIWSRPCTTERAFTIMFRQSVLAYEPLATRERLLNPEFKMPMSFVYGDNDWVRNEVDLNQADRLKEVNKNINVYDLQDSTHDMLFDNPIMLCNLIKNDLLGTDLPVGKDPTRQVKLI